MIEKAQHPRREARALPPRPPPSDKADPAEWRLATGTNLVIHYDQMVRPIVNKSRRQTCFR